MHRLECTRAREHVNLQGHAGFDFPPASLGLRPLPPLAQRLQDCTAGVRRHKCAGETLRIRP